MAPSDPQTNVRLPKNLKEWLAQKAASNRRSLAGEVVVRLEASREMEPDAQKAKGHTAPTVAPSCESTPSKEDGTQNGC